MIISVSRRTDIPALYSDWFFNRVKEQFVYVPNPMNIHQVSKVSLKPEVVDCIVFWTKNPKPMLNQLNKLKDYQYYFQFTLNSYGKDIEVNLPSKNNELIPTFKRLSETIGPQRVIWRYDPILLNKKYTIQYHLEYFNKLVYKLSSYTNTCTISFIDFYRHASRNLKGLELEVLSYESKIKLAKGLADIAKQYSINLTACAEDIDLLKYNISPANCIDAKLIEELLGFKLKVTKDKNQRKECNCISSIDIGMYNTCNNGCRYCYANYSEKTVQKNILNHNTKSPLLFGEITEKDIIKERVVRSYVINQMTIRDR